MRCASIQFSVSMGVVLLCLLYLLPVSIAEAADNPKQEIVLPKFKPYIMEHNYFYCTIPEHWRTERDADKDKEYGIYEIVLTAPLLPKEDITVNISYYLPDNADFKDYRDFINRNSKDVFGKRGHGREQYLPVKKVTLNGMKGFQLMRTVKRHLNPNSKSDAYVWLKEKHYVLPIKKGFYVLHYKAPVDSFDVFLGDFEQIAASFRREPPPPEPGMKVVMP